MIFKITKLNNEEILIQTKSWLDLLLSTSLSNDVVKIEKYDEIGAKHTVKAESEEV